MTFSSACCLEASFVQKPQGNRKDLANVSDTFGPNNMIILCGKPQKLSPLKSLHSHVLGIT